MRAIALALVAGCAGTSARDPGPPRPDPVDTGSSTADTGAGSTGGFGTAPPAPSGPCTFDAAHRSCPHATVELRTGALGTRAVHYELPPGTPPSGGWPAVILFQGSFFDADKMWDATPTDPFGAWYQTETIGRLLDAGYAVLTPEALFDGATFWTTNVPPFVFAWTTSPDHELMLALFEAIDDGTFGGLDGGRVYAGGISSGGYMSSRMAEAYPGRFRALVVHSASWCTCGGGLCVVPQQLPADHPPTLFLHGEQDPLAPLGAMQKYADRMTSQGLPHRVVTDPAVGHAWLPVAPTEVVRWFDAHP